LFKDFIKSQPRTEKTGRRGLGGGSTENAIGKGAVGGDREADRAVIGGDKRLSLDARLHTVDASRYDSFDASMNSFCALLGLGGD
jgi:hypothetical protein